MAQSTSQTGGQTRQLLTAKNLAVSAPAAGTTTLIEVPTAGLHTLGVQVDVTAQALDAFAITARFNESGGFVTLYSTAGSFTTPAGLLIGASGDLTTQGAGTTGWFVLDVRGLYSVKVTCSGAVNNALIDVYAGGAG